MLASERTAIRSVQPMLTVATITLLGLTVAADVTGLLAPASVWGTMALWDLGAAVAVALAIVALGVTAALTTAAASPSRRSDFMRDLIMFAVFVAAAVSFILRVRSDAELPSSPAVMSALVAMCACLIAAFFETDAPQP